MSALEWVCGQLFQNEASSETRSTMNREFLKLLIRLPVNLSLTKPLNEPSLSAEEISLKTCIEYGPIIDHCLSAYWKCILYALRHHSTTDVPTTPTRPLLSIGEKDGDALIRIGSSSVESVASVCVDYLDIVTVDLATPLYCLAVLIPQVCC